MLPAEEFSYQFGSSLGAGDHEKMPLPLQDVHFGTADGAAQDMRVVQLQIGKALIKEPLSLLGT